LTHVMVEEACKLVSYELMDQWVYCNVYPKKHKNIVVQVSLVNPPKCPEKAVNKNG
jgi:hypothetical protein